MIISASYRTDIPAFYGTWFMARLDAGFCRVVNPYGRQVTEIRLTPGAVDGFVFWTRNPGPFRSALTEVARRGYPFVVQMTATGYPRALESSVIDRERAVAEIAQLHQRFGPRVAVWRYDPILVTSLTPVEWHVENFAAFARALRGKIDEAVVSFAQIYRKTARNLEMAARRHGFTWRDPLVGEKHALLARLAEIAAEQSIRLTLCTQPELAADGLPPARCIDAARLSDVAARDISAREKGNRPGCLCAESRDIGDYDTCPHGCVYCYAVQSPVLARQRHKAHDPARASLTPETEPVA
ncbi:MAG: DUF1848 domain-containing protein [Alphaproteobacteria bacterium]|nr:DUF1848 domain-containing protein [Alphaproteobacteria bacterium]